MIPISLKITGFLSYQESAELDFQDFDLACISGNNGAGKSSLMRTLATLQEADSGSAFLDDIDIFKFLF